MDKVLNLAAISNASGWSLVAGLWSLSTGHLSLVGAVEVEVSAAWNSIVAGCKLPGLGVDQDAYFCPVGMLLGQELERHNCMKNHQGEASVPLHKFSNPYCIV